jgi:hypothetical protein
VTEQERLFELLSRQVLMNPGLLTELIRILARQSHQTDQQHGHRRRRRQPGRGSCA